MGKQRKGGDPCLVRLQGYRENRWVLFGLWSNLPKSSDAVIFDIALTEGRPKGGLSCVKYNGAIVAKRFRTTRRRQAGAELYPGRRVLHHSP